MGRTEYRVGCRRRLVDQAFQEAHRKILRAAVGTSLRLFAKR